MLAKWPLSMIYVSLTQRDNEKICRGFMTFALAYRDLYILYISMYIILSFSIFFYFSFLFIHSFIRISLYIFLFLIFVYYFYFFIISFHLILALCARDIIHILRTVCISHNFFFFLRSCCSLSRAYAVVVSI